MGRASGGRTATLILLALAGSAGFAGVQARPAADFVVEGTTKIVQGVHETAKGVGQTLTRALRRWSSA
jgi:hypothetical protein